MLVLKKSYKLNLHPR